MRLARCRLARRQSPLPDENPLSRHVQQTSFHYRYSKLNSLPVSARNQDPRPPWSTTNHHHVDQAIALARPAPSHRLGPPRQHDRHPDVPDPSILPLQVRPKGYSGSLSPKRLLEISSRDLPFGDLPLEITHQLGEGPATNIPQPLPPASLSFGVRLVIPPDIAPRWCRPGRPLHQTRAATVRFAAGRWPAFVTPQVPRFVRRAIRPRPASPKHSPPSAGVAAPISRLGPVASGSPFSTRPDRRDTPPAHTTERHCEPEQIAPEKLLLEFFPIA